MSKPHWHGRGSKKGKQRKKLEYNKDFRYQKRVIVGKVKLKQHTASSPKVQQTAS